jgi:Holliday junction resolvase RusA-like endonuclease
MRGKYADAYVPKGHPIHAYRQSILAAFLELNATYRRPITGAVSVGITFWFPRLKCQTFKRKEMNVLAKISKPDVDNLAKGVLDALEGHAFAHDAAVVELRVSKWHVGNTRARTHIVLSECEDIPCD